MRLQRGVFIDERRVKFAGRANHKAVPGFYLSGQDQNQLSEYVGRLASKHLLLEK
jgi:hypothetical protein